MIFFIFVFDLFFTNKKTLKKSLTDQFSSKVSTS